ncbi:hypothetical protein RIF29_34919 [Crotalaria pallida]|uniref:Uncharacterized protein n=1 Tax=Crotalaria pallida TaxID=3830 RepID=A0AAN9E9V2_CROPI
MVDKSYRGSSVILLLGSCLLIGCLGDDDLFLDEQITNESTCAQQINGDGITTAEFDNFIPRELPEPLDTQNLNVTNQTQIASSLTLSPGNFFEIDNIISELQNDSDTSKTCLTNLIDDHDDINELISELQGEGDVRSLISEGKEVCTGTSFKDILAELEEALLCDDANEQGTQSLMTPPTIATNYSSSKGVEKASPLPGQGAANTSNWASMLQELGGQRNSFQNVQTTLNNNSWASASFSAPSSSRTPNIGLQSSTSGIIKESSQGVAHQVIATGGGFSLDARNITSSGGMGRQLGSMAPPNNAWSSSTSISENWRQNLLGHKRNLLPSSPLAPNFLLSAGMNQTIDPPPVLSLVPMDQQPGYVKTWEGLISGTFYDNATCYYQTKVYRKVTALEELTIGWPRRLHVSTIVRQCNINDQMSMYRGPVDYLILEIQWSSKKHLQDCLSSRGFICMLFCE